MDIPVPPSDSIVSAEVRRRAEAIVEGSYPVETLTDNQDLRAIIQELRVHQIELSIQNEEMRQTQQALERTQGRYFELYHFAPVGYLTLDGHGLVLELNLAVAELLGRDYKFIVGKPWVAYLATRSHPTFFAHLQRVLHTRIAQSCELLIRRQDGETLFIHMESMVAPDEAGALSVCRSVIMDITIRKKTEENLQRYVTILKKLPVAVCALELESSHDPQSLRVIWLNEAFERILGEREGVLIGQLYRQVFPKWLHLPQLSEIALAGYGAASLEIGLSGERPLEPHYLYLQIFPLVQRGVTLILEDITPRKLVERQLRQDSAAMEVQLNRSVTEAMLFKHWLDEAADGFMLAHFETLYLSYANRTVCQWLGYDYERHEMVGLPYKELWPQHDMTLTEILPLVESQPWRGKIQQRDKTGQVFEVLATIATIADTQGHPAKLGITWHITALPPVVITHL